MVWVKGDLKDHPVPPLAQAGATSSTPGCSQPHPTQPWTLPGWGNHNFSGEEKMNISYTPCTKLLLDVPQRKSLTERNTNFKHHIPCFRGSGDNLLNTDKVHVLCISAQLVQLTEAEESTLTHNTQVKQPWKSVPKCWRGKRKVSESQDLTGSET